MKILVTGATGFLGSHLVKALIKTNNQVLIVKRNSSNTWRIKDELAYVSIYNLERYSWEDIFLEQQEKIDMVIHTATCYGRHGTSIGEVFDTNVSMPLKLLETAVKFNTNMFINTDSYFCKDIFCNEEANSYQYLTFYTLSKRQFLAWGKQFAFNKKIIFVNAILEHMFGPLDNEDKFTMHIISNLLSNSSEIQLTPGEQKRDFIYVDDVVSAYQTIISNVNNTNDFFREYEIGSGQAVGIKRFVETAKLLTKSYSKLKFGAMPYRTNEIMESCANIKNLLSIGWYPTIPLEEGILRILHSVSVK